MISIKKVCVSELQQLVNDHSYLTWDNIPISRHRAMSYIHNPRCLPTDAVLYLAYIGNRLVGYRTIFPDSITSGDKIIKVGWLSGNWVDPNFRRKGIASMLFKSAMADWNNRLLFTNYAEESKAVYDKTGYFKSVCTLSGVRLYIRPCLTRILCTRGRKYKVLKPIWQIIDFLLSIFNPVPLFLRLIRQPNGIKYEYLNLADDETINVFESETKKTPTHRLGIELNWILNHPWLVSAPLGDVLGKKYYFSSSPKRFESMLVKVYRDNDLLGFFLANLNDRFITTPYIICREGEERVFAKAILKHALALGAFRITTFNEMVGKELKRLTFLGWLSLNQKRNFFASNSIYTEIGNNLTFIEGDGDCAFV
jgi:GNAT superfamily N-acetyltransferase